MKRIKQRLAALLVVLTLLLGCTAPAFAAKSEWIDLDRRGSIKVSLFDTETAAPVPGGELTLYRVASVKLDDGNLSFAYTNGFEDCGIELGDLSESELAVQLAKHIAETTESKTVEVGSAGVAEFTDLELGLYLVLQSTPATDYDRIQPFLVSVPMQENGRYIYNVDALPKAGTATHNPPPDTPDKPEGPDKPDNPEKPETPDTPDDPKNPNAPDPNNPDGWVLDGRPEADRANPNAPDPNNPKGWVLGAHGLPQTGQLNWPVPVLLAAGCVLMAVGGFLRRKGCRHES